MAQRNYTAAQAWHAAQRTGVDTRAKNPRRDAIRAANKARKNELYAKLASMRADGMCAREIATALGVNIRFVYGHWKTV